MTNKDTTTIICTQCEKTYELATADYKRRLKKLPGNTNFFCNRSCSATHRNLKRVERVGMEEYTKGLRPTPNNDFGRKYPPELSWYIHRVFSDNRENAKPVLIMESDKQNFAALLEELWNRQEGKCAFTNTPLKRRLNSKEHQGVVDTDNPFEIASIDRIDSNLPYQEGNIQWVSVAMNQAKGNLDDTTFREYVKKYLNF